MCGRVSQAAIGLRITISAMAVRRKVATAVSVVTTKKKAFSMHTKRWTLLKVWRLDPGLAAGPQPMEAALAMSARESHQDRQGLLEHGQQSLHEDLR